MIFDSIEYAGPCACGRNHVLATEFCVVESGALLKIADYMNQFSLKGVAVAVYDENTYLATEGKHPKVDLEVILPSDDLHANEHGVDLLMERLSKNVEILIAIGSGTIHDITRYCAYTLGVDFISCPTAASVDGFCSSVAAMTWKGCKKTLTAIAPKIVVADLDVIKRAPIRLAKSGFGDMVGKYVALTDWKIGKILKNEYYCERIASLTLKAAEASISALDGILSGNEAAFETLTFGLLLSGLAMQMIGNSRPASGAEHHISHLIEMEPSGLNVSSDALHGEKVGVGTLLVLNKYQSLLDSKKVAFFDYETFSEDRIISVFGREKADEIKKENSSDSADGITVEVLNNGYGAILEELRSLPSAETLSALFKKAGVRSSLDEIGVSVEFTEQILKFAPMVRNRLTLLRLLSQGVIR